MYDVAIIGVGPAGMTAAVYTARKSLNTLVVGQYIGGQMAESLWVENGPGHAPSTGVDLTDKFYQQMLQQGAHHQFDEVVDMERIGDDYRLHTKLGKAYEARAVIVASGTQPRSLNVPGEEEFRGRGISHCTTCDAPAFIDAAGPKPNVGIIGGGNSGLLAAVELMPMADQMYIVSLDPWWGDEVYQAKLKTNPNVREYSQYVVERFNGSERLESMTIRRAEDDGDPGANGRIILPVRAVFVEIGSVPTGDFTDGLVEKMRGGAIVVDQFGQTSAPGVFAAGDVTGPRDKEIATAVGQGATAALTAFEYLSQKQE
ncbi:MAG: FAD-dependent oxidoreductase [Dehalococcoidia bacterium]